LYPLCRAEARGSFEERRLAGTATAYIDIYDMTQSVEDGATRHVYYKSYVKCLKLNGDVLCYTQNRSILSTEM